jgi:hypothetical protein
MRARQSFLPCLAPHHEITAMVSTLGGSAKLGSGTIENEMIFSEHIFADGGAFPDLD